MRDSTRTAGLLDEAEGTQPNPNADEPLFGSPEYFGRHLRSIRVLQGKSLRQWATEAGIDPSVLSRIERGEQRPPPKAELVAWAQAWGLRAGERINVLVAAEYLPIAHTSLTDEDATVIMGAMRELFGPPDTRDAHSGYVEMLQNLLDRVRPVVPATRAFAGARMIGAAQARVSRGGRGR